MFACRMRAIKPRPHYKFRALVYSTRNIHLLSMICFRIQLDECRGLEVVELGIQVAIISSSAVMTSSCASARDGQFVI